MIPIWTYYPTVVGVLYETLTVCDRCELTQAQQQDLQLFMHHSLVEHWFVRLMSWTMLVSKCAMVQGQWYLCWYTTSQTLESYMMHGQCARGVENPIVNSKALNYTFFTLWCYTDSRHKKLNLCPSIIAQWSNDNDTRMDMLLHRHWSVIWCMDNVWQAWPTPRTTARLSTTHTSHSGVAPLLGRNSSMYAHM